MIVKTITAGGHQLNATSCGDLPISPSFRVLKEQGKALEDLVNIAKESTTLQRSKYSSNPKLKDKQEEMLPERILFLRYRHVYAGKGGWFGCHCKSSKCGNHNNGISTCLCVSPLTNRCCSSHPVSQQNTRHTPRLSNSKHTSPRQHKTIGDVKTFGSKDEPFIREPLSCVGHGCGDRQKHGIADSLVRKASTVNRISNTNSSRQPDTFRNIVQSLECQEIKMANAFGEIMKDAGEDDTRQTKSVFIKPIPARINPLTAVYYSSKVKPSNKKRITVVTKQNAQEIEQTDLKIERVREMEQTDEKKELDFSQMESKMCEIYILPLNEGGTLEGERFSRESKPNRVDLVNETESIEEGFGIFSAGGDSEKNQTDASAYGTFDKSGSKSKDHKYKYNKNINDKCGFFGNMSPAAKQAIGEYFTENNREVVPEGETNYVNHIALNKLIQETDYITGNDYEDEFLKAKNKTENDNSHHPESSDCEEPGDGLERQTGITDKNRLALERQINEKNIEMNRSRKCQNGDIFEETSNINLGRGTGTENCNDDDDDDIEDISIKATVKCTEWLIKYT